MARLLDRAGAGPGDLLIDLGCGDGRIVVAAALRGARARGIDIDPIRIAEAEAAAVAAGVSDLATFRCEDLFETRLDEATIVTLFLVPHVHALLMPRLRSELGPGSRVAAHAFPLADWEPDGHEVVDGRHLYWWVVPDERPG